MKRTKLRRPIWSSVLAGVNRRVLRPLPAPRFGQRVFSSAPVFLLLLALAVLAFPNRAFAGEFAVTTLNPSTQTAVVGTPVSVNVDFAVGTLTANGIQAWISFDPAKLQAVSVTTAGSSPFTSVFANQINNTAGTLTYGATGSSVANATVTVATIVFNPITDGTASLQFQNVNEYIVGYGPYGVNGPAVGGSVNITSPITWANPAAITYGTLLSTNQLNATATILGSFIYTPPEGTVLAAGTQTLTAIFTPSDLAKSNISKQVTLVVNQAAATVTLGNLSQTYDGALKTASVTTTPADLSVALTYNGSATPPTSAGSYSVVGTVSDSNYTGSASGTLTIAKAPATVTLGNLSQNYNGTPRFATATTLPPGLTVNLTYDGLSSPPTNAGSYTVVGTINEANYSGAATNTLAITAAAAAAVVITWANPAAITYGTTLGATQLNATARSGGTNVAGTLTYTPAAGAILNVGTNTLTVLFAPSDAAQYKSATNQVTLIVNKATATVTLGSLVQEMDWTPKYATATTSPPGLTVNLTYDGGATPPINAGSYSVVGTVKEANYSGSATGTLKITEAADPDVVVGWGFNGYHQATGAASNNNVEHKATNGPVKLNGQLLRGVKEIAAGSSYSLAVTTNYAVIAWGDGDHGRTNVPAGLTNVMAIAAGNFHGMALSNSYVVVWGDNLNTHKLKTLPAGVALGGVVGIAAGYSHAVALRVDDKVFAWGDNSNGQTNVPTAALANSGIWQIAAGYYHNLVLRSDGTVVAWGKNNNGQVTSPSSSTAVASPVRLNGQTLTNVIAIAAGASHSVALLDDQTVKLWGSVTSVPPGLNNVIAISAGQDYTLAMRSDGTVVAWGAPGTPPVADYGQATNVPTGLRSLVRDFGVQVLDGPQIAAGTYHALAIARQPGIESLSPAEIVGGTSQPMTLTVNGAYQSVFSGITPNSVVYWNGTPLATTFQPITGSEYAPKLIAQVPANLLPVPASGIATAQITVVSPGGLSSAPKPFTIKAGNVGSTQSRIAAPGQSTFVQTLPPSWGQPGLSASFVNNSGSPATVTTAVYTSAPVAGTSITTGAGFVDLQISGADSSDSATVQFYYSPSVTGAAEAALVLRYYNGAAWVPILSSGSATPIKNTTDDLEGTSSGGRFTVLFDNASTPVITNLSGTFIAMALNQAPAALADAVTVAAGSVLAVGAPGVLGNDTDPDDDLVRASLISASSHGQVTLQPDGSFTYTPQADYTGPDEFSYVADDGHDISEVATVAITVTSANTPPVIANQTGEYGAPFSYTIPATAFSDVGASQTVNYGVSGLPPGIVVDAATRSLSGTPKAAGVFLAQVTASDPGAIPPWSATASFTFTVNKATLSVTAGNAARDYGQANPPLSGTLLGVVNNDNLQATYSASATESSAVGTYPIVPSLIDLERKLGNYWVTQNNGTLTVRGLPPVVDAGPDQSVEATDLNGAVVTVNASASTDPGNSIVSYQWSEGAMPLGSGASISFTLGLGVHAVRLSVTDARGLTSAGPVNITVQDTQPPSLTVPAPIVVSATPGSCDAAVNFTINASDAASTVTVVSTPGSGATFPLGTTTVTSIATDASGNTTTQTFTVTVNDTEAPSVTVPAPILASNTPGSCDAVVSYTVTAADNCSGVNVVSTPASGSTFPKGTTTVTSVATDASGNTTTQTFTVTVNDTEAPSVTVPSPIVLRAAAGRCDAAVSFTVTAADNCPGVTVVSTPASESLFPLGTTTVTSVATDASGNVTTRTFAVTVKENVEIGRAVVVARNSVWLKQKSVIHSGDVIVNDASTGPVLSDGVELSVGQNVTTPAGFALRANRISLGQKSVINGDVFFNELEDNQKSTITGARHTPLPLSVFCALPSFQSAAPGSQNIAPKQGESVTLNAGDYGDVVLKQKSTLRFTGGTYNLRNLDIGQDVDVLFAAPSIVRIAGRFALDQKSILGPDAGSGIGAKDIVIYVAGVNGKDGKLNGNPDAAKIGENCVVRANFYVPNGTLFIQQKTTATGAFLARDVGVGENVELSLESAFGPASSGGVGLLGLRTGESEAQFVAAARPRLVLTSQAALELQFTGKPGSTYTVEASPDLTHWEPLTEVQMGQEGLIRFTDLDSKNLKMRFYRLIPQPAGPTSR